MAVWGGDEVTAGDAWDGDVSLPPEWFNLTLDRRQDAAGVDAQLAERIQRQPELAPAREILRQMLLSFADDGRALDAGFGAMRWEDHEFLGVVSATMLVHRLERDATMCVDDNLAELSALLSAPIPSDQFSPRVDEVALTCGRALRMEAVRGATTQPTEEAGQGSLLLLSVQYWIPMVGSADLVELSFTSSNLLAAHELSEEFAGIAESLAITAPASGA